MQPIFIACDNNIDVYDLTDQLTGETIDDALLPVVLLDSDGDPLDGTAINLELVAVPPAGRVNHYHGVIPSTGVEDLTEGSVYPLKFLPSSSGRNVMIRPKYKAAYYEGEEEE